MAKKRQSFKDIFKKQAPFDFTFFLLLMALLAFGLLMLFSASAPTAAHEPFNNPFYFVLRQGMWAVIGLVGMFFFSRRDYRFWKRFARLFILLSFLLLIAVLIIGTEINGAQRWLPLGPLSFQPSELVKIMIILALASFLSRGGDNIKKFWRGLFPYMLLLGGIALLLLLQPHLSCTVVIVGTACIMFLIAGAKWLHYLIVGFLAAPVGVWLIMSDQERMERFLSYLDPWKYKKEGGWQVIQSLYAIGSGGLFGLGFTQSRQKFLYIPEPYNDFIFAIVCEELGFIGAILFITLFTLLIIRGIKIAVNAPDTFGTLAVAGLTTLIAVQFFLNVAVVTSSVPVTGMPLPFFSYGGSALCFLLWSMGIVLNVSRQTKEIKKV